MTWILSSAKAEDGVCEIVYSQTTVVEGEAAVVETKTVKHHQSNGQDTVAWHANIKREIAADLLGLNKTEPTAVDITAMVS